MELSDLRVFIEVVENDGVTAAAAKLNRVPSNVTARIKKLEQQFDKPLFLRVNNRLKISPEGELLLPYAKQLLTLAQQTMDEVTDSKPKGKLCLGSTEAAAATRLVKPLVKFHNKYPDVELELQVSPSGDSIKRVLEGELDMALVSDIKPDSRLKITPVFNETLVMVSDLKHKAIKQPQDLDKDPTLLGFSSRCAYRTRLSNWMEQGENIVNAIEINSYNTLLSCVAAGMGVGIVPLDLLKSYPFAKSIQVHELPARWRQSVTSVICRNDSARTNVNAFLQCIDGNIN